MYMSLKQKISRSMLLPSVDPMLAGVLNGGNLLAGFNALASSY
jgi:hypothetical protein